MKQLQKLKSYMMPISMLVGIIFYNPFYRLSFLTQYLIFTMLFISYLNISLRDVKFKKLHLYLLCIQLFGSVLIYLGLLFFNPIVAQGAMICVLAPTATSAVVITYMLGGNTASLTAYSLMSNATVAITAPFFFSFISDNQSLSFWSEFAEILEKVFILLLLPFVLGVLMNKFLPQLSNKIKTKKSISFYLWNISLVIVTARTVQYLVQEGASHISTVFILFFLILIICSLQFLVGRKLGRRFDDTIAGGQGLGQKNTVLAIWMAQTYLNPLSSIAPSAYILWQNLINSYQVWRKQRSE